MTIDLFPYAELKVWAEMFNDAQQQRIRTHNRIESSHVFPEVFAEELEAAVSNEYRIRLALRRQYRKTAPAGVIEWQKSTKGVGIDLLARLLGHLGHPRIATPYHWEGTGTARDLVADEPYERTVGQLWAYCGHGDAERKRRSGMTADDAHALGIPILKMLTHLLAERAIRQPGAKTPHPTIPPPLTIHASSDEDPFVVTQKKTETQNVPGDDNSFDTATIASAQPSAGSWPYRTIYDQRRLVTFDRTHNGPCVRCGPSGRPAPHGSPWSKGHQLADALRIVGKTILRDLWLAADDGS